MRNSVSSAPDHNGSSGGVAAHLRDFTADRRLVLLVAMALVVGTAGAGAAWALLHLINLATNLAYYGRVSTEPVSIVGNALGPVSVLIPVIGCLIIGLMARYGSEKIRGHGIPEAMEAETARRMTRGAATAARAATAGPPI